MISFSTQAVDVLLLSVLTVIFMCVLRVSGAVPAAEIGGQG